MYVIQKITLTAESATIEYYTVEGEFSADVSKAERYDNYSDALRIAGQFPYQGAKIGYRAVAV